MLESLQGYYTRLHSQVVKWSLAHVTDDHSLTWCMGSGYGDASVVGEGGGEGRGIFFPQHDLLLVERNVYEPPPFPSRLMRSILFSRPRVKTVRLRVLYHAERSSSFVRNWFVGLWRYAWRILATRTLSIAKNIRWAEHTGNKQCVEPRKTRRVIAQENWMKSEESMKEKGKKRREKRNEAKWKGTFVRVYIIVAQVNDLFR